MFKFCNLYSGSSGNCTLVQTDNANILVDFGVSCKKVNEALETQGLHLSDIDAVLLSHEHTDHTKGLKTYCKNYDHTIIGTKGTLDSINDTYNIKNSIVISNDETFDFKDLKVSSFEIPHDAADPVAFSLENEDKKFTIATDIGHITNQIIDECNGSNFLLLESNYDPNMLIASKYPYYLKKRILGPLGHLSNDDASEVISTLSKNGVNNIMLGHLSNSNNLPVLAYQTVLNKINSLSTTPEGISLSVAKRDEPNDVIDI